MFLRARTCDGEDEEARGDRGGAVEHDADVATRQLHVIRRVGDQNRGQQEADGRSQLRKRNRHIYLHILVFNVIFIDPVQYSVLISVSPTVRGTRSPGSRARPWRTR